MNKKCFVIIGGGAAGIFCAVNTARMNPAIRVIVLEKSNKLLSKVKISGGGRCNVTHDCDSISTMASCYPRGEKFVKKTFQHFFTNDTVAWFESRGVPLKVESDGRVFPVSNSSESIINCLLQEAQQYNIEIIMHAAVKSICKTTYFTIGYNDTSLNADWLCIATGGFPKIEQYYFLEQLKHTIEKPTPSLFTFNLIQHPILDLPGIVAQNASIKINGFKKISTGPLLITHWGLSGPAVLKLSAYAALFLYEHDYKYAITINWNTAFNETSILQFIREYRQTHASKKINTSVFDTLPNRLWQFLLHESRIDNSLNWGDLNAQQQNLFAKTICSYTLICSGKTTFKEEFVTAGGISLDEINPSTLESKLIPDLFFAGELLNIDGITGGYNFQNAWTTGWIVAQSISSHS